MGKPGPLDLAFNMHSIRDVTISLVKKGANYRPFFIVFLAYEIDDYQRT